MKKRLFCALVCLCGLCFSGCMPGAGANVSELLRAPQFSGQYSQVQKALNAYLGEPAQLKYPTGGGHQSPFLFGDWDGNGTEDAAVFYTSPSKGPNVQLAILEQRGGLWQVTQEREGLAAEVESVSTAAMDQETAVGTQLVVGYGTSQGDKYLTVYAYADVTLSSVLETSYSEYLLADITGTGSEDLVVVQPGSQGIQLALLTNRESSYRQKQTLAVSQGRFTGCAGLYSGAEQGGTNYLVLDGYTGSNDGYLASEIFYYDAQSDGLKAFVPEGEEDLYNATLRYFAGLQSRDLNSDGTVEIPAQLTGDEGGLVNPALDRRLTFVEWKDYISPEPAQSFGVVDGEYGFYLELPAGWRGQVELTPGEEKN
ncbi:MAG: hypothetical protein IIV90_00730, partial [Oscillospiraceae bacterium]|nr:hypothetical protein [Oscillospiraceae bacterium]